MELKADSEDKEMGLTGVSASLNPTGNKDDMDFELHLKKDYMGAETTEIMYEGSGRLNDETDFTFKGPVKLWKLKYILKDEYQEEFKIDTMKIVEDEWIFDTPKD